MSAWRGPGRRSASSGWWGDVNARAAGLRSALPSAADLHSLAGRRSPAELGEGLRGLGVELPDGPAATAGGLDRSVRVWAAGRLELLRRRMGPRRERLARVVLETADRRAVRALVRGAVEAAPPGARLSGLLPSTLLPWSALERLARCDSLQELGGELARLGHPAARPVAAAAATVPDLFALETSLDRMWGARVSEVTRGRDDLGLFVREETDLRNAWTAVALAGGTEVPLDELLLEHGERLTPERLGQLEDAEPARVPGILARLLVGSALEGLFEADARGVGLERRALALRGAAWTRRARARPLGPAPFLAFALRLEACTLDLCGLAWACALDVPAGARAGALPEVA